MSKYKGQLEGFPEEIVNKMLDYQFKQRGKRDIFVFEEMNYAEFKGFSWSKTEEGPDFWYEVIKMKNFDLFFKKYPKTPKYPKVMLVRNLCDRNWEQRVVFMEKNGWFIAWVGAKTLEEAESELGIYCWREAKDIEEPKIIELTIAEIAEKLNIPVETLRIKD